MNIVDVKSNFERKIGQIMEEIPNRLNRELKIIEDRDGTMWRDVKSKLNSNQESISLLKDNLTRSISKITTRQEDITNKVDQTTLKLSSVSHNLGTGDDISRPMEKVSTELEYEVQFLRE